MEAITFTPRRFSPLDVEKAQLASLQMRVEAYNSIPGPDDGTGIECSTCKNRGTIAYINEESQTLTLRNCKCYNRRLTVNRLKRAGVWERAQRCKLEAFEVKTDIQRRMMRAVKTFLDHPDQQWLAMLGQSGAGKTHCTVGAFCEAVTKTELPGQVLLWNKDGRALKGAALDEDNALYNKFKKAPLLLIDDLFKTRYGELPSGADVRLAFEILDDRYNNRLPTIISCELPFDELIALDQAIAGRIREMCGPCMVSIARDPKKNYRFTGGGGDG